MIDIAKVHIGDQVRVVEENGTEGVGTITGLVRELFGDPDSVEVSVCDGPVAGLGWYPNNRVFLIEN